MKARAGKGLGWNSVGGSPEVPVGPLWFVLARVSWVNWAPRPGAGRPKVHVQDWVG